jgi:hypothetical protein
MVLRRAGSVLFVNAGRAVATGVRSIWQQRSSPAAHEGRRYIRFGAEPAV